MEPVEGLPEGDVTDILVGGPRHMKTILYHKASGSQRGVSQLSEGFGAWSGVSQPSEGESP
eukprot:4653743-Lingulodinium_polyedra.AAC.1